MHQRDIAMSLVLTALGGLIVYSFFRTPIPPLSVRVESASDELRQGHVSAAYDELNNQHQREKIADAMHEQLTSETLQSRECVRCCWR